MSVKSAGISASGLHALSDRVSLSVLLNPIPRSGSTMMMDQWWVEAKHASEYRFRFAARRTGRLLDEYVQRFQRVPTPYTELSIGYSAHH